MQNTHIIRRIDDLGRVVIPKEIMAKMGVSEGDSLEIYFDEITRMTAFKLYDDKYEAAQSIEQVRKSIMERDKIPMKIQYEVSRLMKEAAALLKNTPINESQEAAKIE